MIKVSLEKGICYLVYKVISMKTRQKKSQLLKLTP